MDVRLEAAGLRADLATVDALARVALGLRREGHRLLLANAEPQLLALVDLVGLGEALPRG